MILLQNWSHAGDLGQASVCTAALGCQEAASQRIASICDYLDQDEGIGHGLADI